MQIRHFLVYDADTGEVIHVHAESSALGTPAPDLINLVPADGRRLAVIEQPSTEEMPAHPVRVEGGLLQAAEAGTPMAGAGVRSRFDKPHARRRYSRTSDTAK
jgi:hypothetical protein